MLRTLPAAVPSWFHRCLAGNSRSAQNRWGRPPSAIHCRRTEPAPPWCYVRAQARNAAMTNGALRCERSRRQCRGTRWICTQVCSPKRNWSVYGAGVCCHMPILAALSPLRTQHIRPDRQMHEMMMMRECASRSNLSSNLYTTVSPYCAWQLRSVLLTGARICSRLFLLPSTTTRCCATRSSAACRAVSFARAPDSWFSGVGSAAGNRYPCSGMRWHGGTPLPSVLRLALLSPRPFCSRPGGLSRLVG